MLVGFPIDHVTHSFGIDLTDPCIDDSVHFNNILTGMPAGAGPLPALLQACVAAATGTARQTGCLRVAVADYVGIDRPALELQPSFGRYVVPLLANLT
jgi:hypothetical protein